MNSRSARPFSSESGVMILEVLAAAVLILLGLAAIFGINTQSLQILRRSQQAAAASQILQERVETFRTRPWPEVSRGAAVATWWRSPTPSAGDLADARPTERLVVSPAVSPSTTNPRTDSFEIERRDGAVRVVREADLSTERLLLIELTIHWREQQRVQERRLRTIVNRAGLTRSGIFGSSFGRTGTGVGGESSP